jgi:hypothetical protein
VPEGNLDLEVTRPLLDLSVDLTQHLDELDLDESDDDDEPVLRWRDGRLVDTWREGYPS